MGEIKSTLDLVLEKTKHLSQSSAEKQAQVRKDIEMRINGLLKKYQDGVVSKAQLQRDYEALKTEFNLSVYFGDALHNFSSVSNISQNYRTKGCPLRPS